jgi:hypothetical protein
MLKLLQRCRETTPGTRSPAATAQVRTSIWRICRVLDIGPPAHPTFLDHRADVGREAWIGEDESLDLVRGQACGHRHCEKIDLFLGAGADEMCAQDLAGPFSTRTL